jgi:hypothetical protein
MTFSRLLKNGVSGRDPQSRMHIAYGFFLLGTYSGLRVQGSTRTGAIILELLRHVSIGPAGISPRQPLLS